MFSLVCSILIFYMIYKKYITSRHFDKDAADFYRRNGILSSDDLLMGLFLISGISDFISAFTETNLVEKVCTSTAGCLMLASAGIIYMVKNCD